MKLVFHAAALADDPDFEYLIIDSTIDIALLD